MSERAGWKMTIGAQVEGAGTRFRVWSPASERVDVVSYGPSAERVFPLAREADGYFSDWIAGAGHGTRYRYRLDEGESYPDPASRSQPEGVHGPSEVIDPDDFRWSCEGWTGRPLEGLVIYELHIGTFTPAGTFASAVERLDHIAGLGASAVEVMPIANFPGTRNWGYDGVNLFAPATIYGGSAGFKHFVDEAHRRGLGVILDVVYNHLGPDGNYIPAVTGGRFFTDRHRTPWGDAVDFDGPESGPVRDFVLQNALHWLHEYRVDGLRLDATHAIVDDSPRHILTELTDRAHSVAARPVILIAEDERNDRRLLLPREEGGHGLDAVWADDVHHEIRRLLAGDREGYFARYSGTTEGIVRVLEAGWHTDQGGVAAEGIDSARTDGITPARFVHCTQNHDQVGNRAFGERLNHDVSLPEFRAASALLLLSPYTPLLWMGQEWAASTPFLYFTDHTDDLGRLVSQGRREEFGGFSSFRDPDARARIPDPQAVDTFARSVLRWDEREQPPHAGILELYTALLRLRARHPVLRRQSREGFRVVALGEGALAMRQEVEGGGRPGRRQLQRGDPFRPRGQGPDPGARRRLGPPSRDRGGPLRRGRRVGSDRSRGSAARRSAGCRSPGMRCRHLRAPRGLTSNDPNTRHDGV